MNQPNGVEQWTLDQYLIKIIKYFIAPLVKQNNT